MRKSVSAHALLFEEFLVREAEAGRLELPLGAIPAKALVHGHCHQKSFGAFRPVEQVLRLIPGLDVETIESSCCGMAGAFGYGADTYQASMQMAELSLLPAVRPPTRHADRRRWHVVPASDRGRHRPGCYPRRARVGDESRPATPNSPPSPPQRNRPWLNSPRNRPQDSRCRPRQRRREEAQAARHHHSRCPRLRQSDRRTGWHQPDAG